SEANLTVGGTVPLALDPNQYTGKITRTYFEPQEAQAARADVQVDNAQRDPDSGRLVYTLENALKPGFYRLDLTTRDKGGKLGTDPRGFVFNVDTEREGPLQRISRELLETNLQGAPTENIKLYGPDIPPKDLEERQTDFSESPWFYLIFLLVLI